MNPQFWLQKWQDNQIGFHRSAFHPLLAQYWDELRAARGGPVFVPLCGKSLDLLWLAGQGYHVRGVEISPIAVRAFFEEHGLAPQVETQGAFQRYRSDGIEIFCGDFFALASLDLEDIMAVYDRASLIALPAERRRAYATHLLNLLPHRPPILLLTLDYPQEARPGPPFAVGEEEVRRLYEPAWAVERVATIDLRAEEISHGLTRFEEQVFILRNPQSEDGPRRPRT